MLTAAKKEMFSAPMAWTDECVLPLAASEVYPKTRVWGSREKTLPCSSATAPLSGNSRWGCEESSGKTAAGSALDNNGNTQTKVVGTNTTSYAWDYENRLTSVTLPGSGGTVSFKYDPFGRRIYKSSSAGSSVFAYDGDNLIEETNASGAVVARYSQTQNIDETLAMLRSGATSYYHADGLGSVTSLSNPSGALAQSYGYDSFGKQTSSSGSLTNPFQYTARESDPETGLYYYRARYYDASIGKFTSEDPVGFQGLDINMYRYVRNQPNRYGDPIGLVTIDPTFNSNCLRALKQALNILRKLPKKCNCIFNRMGSGRSLTQLLDDPGITIHYDPNPPDPKEPESGYTLPGDTHNIWVHSHPCRMGRWTLAGLLVHELVHITLVPGDGQDDINGPAYGTERACGLSPLPNRVGVAAPMLPPIEPSTYPIPNNLVEP